jgi:Protein tyrosine and serine/threonine kinase
MNHPNLLSIRASLPSLFSPLSYVTFQYRECSALQTRTKPLSCLLSTMKPNPRIQHLPDDVASSSGCSSTGDDIDEASMSSSSSCWNSATNSDSSLPLTHNTDINRTQSSSSYSEEDVNSSSYQHSSFISSFAAAVVRRRGYHDHGTNAQNGRSMHPVRERNEPYSNGSKQRRQLISSRQRNFRKINRNSWNPSVSYFCFWKALLKLCHHHCSTGILCCSIGLWLLIFFFAHERKHHLPMHRPNLPIRQRIRSRRPTPKRSGWMGQFWDRVDTYLFGSIVSAQMRINPDVNQHKDREELPPECIRPPWHLNSFPTCNDVYEVDLPSIVRQSRYALYDGSSENRTMPLGYVAKGLWRSVWSVNPRAVMTEPIVLKTMQKEHELTDRNYDRHRRDAIVMEHLTSSPYVVDIYGFCGNSVLTEYMDLTLDDVIFSNDIDVVIDSKPVPVTSAMKLQWALDVARGVQALHEISGGPIVHTDIQAKQFLLSSTGRVKINDFNRCRFMAQSNITGSPCSFRIPSAPGKSRSPEEYLYEALDEKLDIYSVGNIMYTILTTREAWDGYNGVVAQSRIQEGVIPEIYTNAIQDLPKSTQEALVNITKRAYAFDPKQRFTAKELVAELERILEEIV